ncbi:23S rRNA (uracil(1939)-C(5))-methyltransferase RlmD [bacterium]|nr:23S rRNA (uracil(1939)-C(5))-methyltransferase RlmD [bacterium]
MEVVIHDISSKGLGVARRGGKVLFVEGALVTEKVKVCPTREGSSIIEASLESILETSLDRVSPVCPHFTRCGGCQLQHLSYEGQLKMKHKRVKDALERLGGFENPLVHNVIASPPLHYRNKIQMPVRRGKLGFYGAKSHDFVPVDRCYLHLESSQILLERIESMGIPFEIDTLVMKTASSNGSVLIILCSFGPIDSKLKTFAQKVLDKEQQVAGIYFTQRSKDANFVFGREFILLAGKEAIEDELLGLKFAIYKDAFYQVNPFQVSHLYQYVIDSLDLTLNDRVLDAYCGVGTMTLLAAQRCREATGIECVPSSIESAQKNQELNGIQNASFYLSKAETKISQLEKFDKVILNPPRKGCEKALLEVLLEQRVKKIVYVSCDPSTFARDCKFLRSGYALKSVQPFDLFPQTVHVESVGCLELI